MRTVGEDIFKRHGMGGGKEKYKYDEMSDGKPHILVRGEDFDEEIDNPQSVITAIRKGFQVRGLRIRGTKISEDEVAIQVTGRL
jgi:hypothetical protein